MPPDFLQNRLLAALPSAVARRWSAHADVVDLALDQTLHAQADVLAHAWFPVTAIVSLLHRMTPGGWAEAALVGRDGVVGVPIFLGGGAAPTSAVVRAAGIALRVDAAFLQAECEREPRVLPILLRYAQVLMAQIAQTSICNRHHDVGQALCRRLLLMLDRSEDNRLALTHEQLAEGLGVRRSGVTESALQLQELGLIRYARGRITVLDRRSLEQRSCECYEVVEQECRRLFPGASALA